VRPGRLHSPARTSHLLTFDPRRRSTSTGFLILVIGPSATCLSCEPLPGQLTRRWPLPAGLLRYFAVQRALIRGAYPATRLPVLAVSTLSGAFVLSVFAAVLMA
jgi:hypothetical protein